MRSPPTPEPGLEQDARFPSGAWTGFFLQPLVPGRHWMELHLTFREGTMRGEGRDWVGQFVITGRYETDSGRCHWTKRYLGKHDVFYNGYNEGKGIWGKWQIPQDWHGGFHIWPEWMDDPPQQRLSEALEEPVSAEADADPELVPVAAEHG